MKSGALLLAKDMPRWTPAMADGLPVDSRFVLHLKKK